MDLFEYQAKELFDKHQVPSCSGQVTSDPRQAAEFARTIGAPVMVKAQVKVGGRGKAGGVKYAPNPDAAQQETAAIVGLNIKGHRVDKVMVTEAVDIADEYYVSFLVDRATRSYMAICSVEGGVEIEEVAQNHPDRVYKTKINALTGIDGQSARQIAEQGGLPERIVATAANTIEKLWEVFLKEDALLVEVNPLVRTPDDQVLALDGKVTLDDNALFRHPDHQSFYNSEELNPLEAKAKAYKLHYVKLDGQVGIIGNGAGLVMSTLDVVAYAGHDYDGIKPANFLDIGGGASAKVMSQALDLVLGDSQVTNVLINIFGGITSCVEVAEGILEALTSAGLENNKPLVVRLDGNQAEEGRRILRDAKHPSISVASSMDQAADLAAQQASASKKS